jgi:hypothetical protein
MSVESERRTVVSEDVRGERGCPLVVSEDVRGERAKIVVGEGVLGERGRP